MDDKDLLRVSGFVQQANQAGQKTVGFCSCVAILTNHFLPLIGALGH